MVIQYLIDKYGMEKVDILGTVSRYKAAIIKGTVAKELGVPSMGSK